MPKLIDYPRTTYAGAWELAEIVDDTGGKCAIETAARKLNRKVSGSFKAIIGSAVKFGLLTSKRDLLTTTTLFKRIKHAYDKQEELIFHREAFLTPPLFTQICRKFRSRELPVQMLDVMLIREFGVEEINAQGVAKAFVEGCRMVGLLDERNIVADIDALANSQSPRREIASPKPTFNTFRSVNTDIENNNLSVNETTELNPTGLEQQPSEEFGKATPNTGRSITSPPNPRPAAVTASRPGGTDAIASLFGLPDSSAQTEDEHTAPPPIARKPMDVTTISATQAEPLPAAHQHIPLPSTAGTTYQIQVSGPGVNTTLSITDEEDITIAMALLQKIKRQLNS